MFDDVITEKVAERARQASIMKKAVERTQQARASHFAGRVSLMAGRAGIRAFDTRGYAQTTSTFLFYKILPQGFILEPV